MLPEERSYSEELITLAKALDTAGNAHDLEGVLGLCTDGVVFRTGPAPFTDVAVGKQQLRSMLIGAFRGFHVEKSWNYRGSGSMVTWSTRWSSDYLRNMGVDSVEQHVKVIAEGGKIKSFIATVSPETIKKLWEALK